ncbi:alcohol dehydrogenase catalytic domain-containing protein [Algirhabdus cladophorae]|uniref:alcohol dehydrogenase catalytic domain-containing protein n=1 Tax=Algirhabdus cladophorae TaxID=3377108 RepID=UPI003B849E30
MKALVYTGPKSMAYQDAATPQPSDEVAIVKVHSVGICGSDMHGYLGHDDRRPAPLILGHEAAGVVTSGPMTGKRVTVNPMVTCLECEACQEGRPNICPNRQLLSMPPREGAFAEFLEIPARNLTEIPDDMSFDHAALAEPIAVCWHSVRLGIAALSRPLDKCRALVIGGGAIGVGSALCLKAQGLKAVDVAEPNQRRADVVASIGDFNVIDPINDSLADSTYDLVIDAVGYGGTRASASATVKPGGVIVHIGLGDSGEGFDVRRATLQEITFIGTYTYTDQDFADTVAGIGSGLFGSLDWAEVRPLSEGAAAFSDILSGAVAAPKIILHP